MLAKRIRQLVEGDTSLDFEALALEVFEHQFEALPAYRRMCTTRGVTPSSVSDWRQVPLVPATAFGHLELTTGPAVEVFRSSGTTGGTRSVHHHAHPDLYRAVIDRTFPEAVLGSLQRPPMLSLVPDRGALPDSSLSFMIDHCLERYGSEESVTALTGSGVSAPMVRSFLSSRQRDRRPTVVLGTAFALVELIDTLDRLGLRFRLPPGSRVFETGGTKGRTREIGRPELLSALREQLDVPPERVIREYGMTELTSHFYDRPPEARDRFHAPPWTRVRILDPENLEECAPGVRGLIAVFDLANVGSVAHVLTEDLGASDGAGFRLLGRAAGAELRGCSLTVEEMTA